MTACLLERRPVLAGGIAMQVLGELRAMDADGTWHLRAATVMPDHVHLFASLGERLTLSRSIARLKSRTRIALTTHQSSWQSNFYDHRLRPHDSAEATLRYIWLNPYAAGLAKIGDVWPYFYCAPQDWEWFQLSTHAGEPFPDWLQ